MSSLFLKLIAVFFMTLDHIGATSNIYYLRIVGRIAFPIFAFLVAQSCIHTKDRKAYLLRLFIFAIIAEPFFDFFINSIYGINVNPFEFSSYFILSYQNVIFTFLLGSALCFIDNSSIKKTHKILYMVLILVVGLILRSDYDILGIGLVYGLYKARNNKLYTLGVLLMFTVLLYSTNWHMLLGSWISIIFILMYNGTSGKVKNEKINNLIKYSFYFYYPLHMFILGLS